jgi:hypothetical protein
MHHGAGAHGARLNRNKEFTVLQTVVTHGCTGFAEGDDFGVGGWVGAGDVAVPSPANSSSVADHDCSDWNFSRLKRALSAAQGFFHPQLVGTKPVGMKFVGTKPVGDGLSIWILGLAMVACGCFLCGHSG